MMVVLIDKMLKTQIVECSTIVNWIFSDEMSSQLTSFYVWEIFNSTLNRMNQHVGKTQHDYNEFMRKAIDNEVCFCFLRGSI